MKKITATILGFLIAPIVPAAYLALTTPITREYKILVQLPLILAVYNFTLTFTVIFGVPAFLLARYFRIIRWWSALAAGILIGAIVVVLIHLPHTHETQDFQDFIVNCLLGGATGFTFWLIWKCGREPNKGDKKTTGNESNQGEAAQ